MNIKELIDVLFTSASKADTKKPGIFVFSIYQSMERCHLQSLLSTCEIPLSNFPACIH